MNFKGALPTLILKTLSDGASHGYAIARSIKSESKGVLDFKEGTLYPALHALEGKDLIRSRQRTEDGRVRKYYRLTEKGRKALGEEREQWLAFSQAVTQALEGRA